MRIVSWQTILMKYHYLFFSKIWKDVTKFVVCCSRDWRFKGELFYEISKMFLEQVHYVYFGCYKLVHGQVSKFAISTSMPWAVEKNTYKIQLVPEILS